MKRVDQYVNIINEISELSRKARVLDLGCGNGDLVLDFHKRNYEAFGCDFNFKKGKNVEFLKRKGWIKAIEPPYRLPFENEYFDLVVSDQVFEHVADFRSTLFEIKRVLKPSGNSLHIFPSRYCLIEPHKYIPFGTVIQSRWWLSIWAMLGIRTKDQKNKGIAEIVNDNYRYLKNNTNYITKARMKEYVLDFFDEIIWCEKQFLKFSRRGRFLYKLSKLFPVIPNLYGTFRDRALFLK